MTIEYKVSKKSKWKFFYKIILHITVTFILVFVVSILMMNVKVEIFPKLVLLVFGWYLIFDIIPLTILFINHMRHSIKVLLVYDKSNRSFSYINSSNEVTFFENEIINLKLYLTPPAFDKRFDILFFGRYHYAEIILKDDESIIVSCLVCDDISKIVSSKLIQRKKKFFPIIS